MNDKVADKAERKDFIPGYIVFPIMNRTIENSFEVLKCSIGKDFLIEDELSDINMVYVIFEYSIGGIMKQFMSGDFKLCFDMALPCKDFQTWEEIHEYCKVVIEPFVVPVSTQTTLHADRQKPDLRHSMGFLEMYSLDVLKAGVTLELKRDNI